MTGKCRVAPIKGITVPKAEFNGLLDLSRLLKTVIRSMSTLPELVYILGDSECSISIIEKSGSALSPYFSNQAAEIRSNISEIVGRCAVEPLAHIPDELNPSDVVTREHATESFFAEGSVWKNGPEFLRDDENMWPIS